MRVDKLSIFKIMDILQDMQQKGYEYVSLEIEDTPERHVITIHPAVELPEGDPKFFNKDLIE